LILPFVSAPSTVGRSIVSGRSAHVPRDLPRPPEFILGTRSCRFGATQAWCRANFPNSSQWPPYSPNLSLLENFIWSLLEAKTCAKYHRSGLAAIYPRGGVGRNRQLFARLFG
jgi:hypothetical protein